MPYRIINILIILNLPFACFSQIVVYDNKFTQQELVQKLAGKGVVISNITFDCPVKKGKIPYGYFEDNVGALGVDKGLLLTCGAAALAAGPNDDPCATQQNGYENLNDPDLASLLTTEKRLSDICKVEFDIIAPTDTLIFNYVFGSDEYLEYVTAGYHDVFGFFISGPGFFGKQNIAVLPNSLTPVDVNTINTKSNPSYYVDNGTGSTPFINLDVQYDGYTVMLQSKVVVIPCEVYHLKIAIADVKDATCDSGVFLEHGSFTSSGIISTKIKYEHPGFSTAIEGCNKAFIIFKRDNKIGNQTVNYTIQGSATNGIDYSGIPNSILIPAGQDSAFIEINAFADNISDAGENVKLLISSDCPNLPFIDTVQIIINEHFDLLLPDAQICPDETVQLNKNYHGGDSIVWLSNSALSCSSCSSPYASPSVNSEFYYTATDPVSGCTAQDSLSVSLLPPPLADFSFTTDPDYTPYDIFFSNLSLNADQYLWDFGDGSTSTEADPFHVYTDHSKNLYHVKLISKIAGHICSDTITKDIHINPFLIPNIITVNNDNKNETFEIIGIVKGQWNMSIYNRWGELVFKTEGYNNDWNGDGFSTGLYYYLLENKHKDRTFHGWLHVVR
jgi:gliding motility-associated-like protein